MKFFTKDLSGPNSVLDLTKLQYREGLDDLEDAQGQPDIYFAWGVSKNIGNKTRVADTDIVEKNGFYVDLDLRKYLKDKPGKVVSDEELEKILREEILVLLDQDEFLKNYRYVVFSGNGYHIYYLDREFQSFSAEGKYTKQHYRDATHMVFSNIANLLGEYGGCVDSSASNISRLARFPGSYNTKREKEYGLERKACEILIQKDAWIDFKKLLDSTTSPIARVKSPEGILFVKQTKDRKYAMELKEEVEGVTHQGAKELINKINEIPIEKVVTKLTGLTLADDGYNFVSLGETDYKGFFKDKHGENKVIWTGTHHIPAEQIVYNSYELMYYQKGESHKKTIEWFFLKFPELNKINKNRKDESIDINEYVGENYKFAPYDKTMNHFGIAKVLEESLHIKSGTNGAFYQYDPGTGLWSQKGDSEISQQVIDELLVAYKKMIDTAILTVSEVEKILKALNMVAVDKDIVQLLYAKESFDICFSDVIYDPRTGIKRPYALEEYKTIKLEVSSKVLEETREPVEFLKMLDEIFENNISKNDIIKTIQKFMGYCFLPTNRYAKAMIFRGKGSNGKSLLLQIIREVVGVELTTQIEVSKIGNDQQIRANLVNKLVAIDYDLDPNFYLDQGVIKSIVSGESISGKIVYLPPFNFIPYAKLMVGANVLPRIKNNDDSITRRFIVIHFNNSFLGREDVNKKEKVLVEKELIIARALKGLKEIVEEGGFKVPDSIQTNIETLRDVETLVKDFVEEHPPVSEDKKRIFQHQYLDLLESFAIEELPEEQVPPRNELKKLLEKGSGVQKGRSSQGMIYKPAKPL